jgi:uncharacterized membrane protein
MVDIVLIGLHIPAGLTALAAGLVAMLSRKGAWWHRKAGAIYLTAILVLTVTAAGLVATRGVHFLHLFALGTAAASLAIYGYARRRDNEAHHITGMGLSYVVMVTAFYVDNGPKLPFWEVFPDWAFWWGHRSSDGQSSSGLSDGAATAA